MARAFNGTSESIDCGVADNLDGPWGAVTCWAWIYPVSYGGANAGRIIAKGGPAAFTMNNNGAPTVNSFGIFVGYDTTATEAYGPNGTPPLSQWSFVAAAWSPGTGGPRLYTGDESTALSEVGSYQSRLQEVGTGLDLSALNAYLGDRGTGDRFFEGRIGPCGAVLAALTLAQLEVLRRFTYTARGRHAWRALYMLNEQSSTVRDYSGSGNTGTPTGTTWIKGPRHTVRPHTVVA